MSAAIQKTTTETLADLLRSRKDAIAQLVPKHLTAERLMRVAVNCVAKTPGLQKCTPTSLLQSALVAAELGLEPGGALGHLYLVPMGNVCTPIVGYRGLIALARRSGDVTSVRSVVVHERDKFRLTEGIEQSIEHEPCLDGDPGPMRYVYCVIKLKDGGVQVELMSRHQVDAIRARSRASNNGPWVTDYEEMARKTVARRGLKWAPLSSEVIERALELDTADYVDGEVVQQALDVQASLKERVAAKTNILRIPEEIPAEPASEDPVPDPKPTPSAP
jgi:recombination protein RecT